MKEKRGALALKEKRGALALKEKRGALALKENIEAIIRDALDEVNEQRGEDRKLEYSLGMRIMGRDSELGSLDFVTLVMVVEELVSERLGKDISIVSDQAFSQERSPFATAESLADFISELVSKS